MPTTPWSGPRTGLACKLASTALALAATATLATGQVATWTGAINLNWNNNGNWDTMVFPNSSTSQAIITPDLLANTTIAFGANITVNSILFGDSGGDATFNLTLGSNNTLFLAPDNTDPMNPVNPTVTSQGGTNVINRPITLNAPPTFSHTSTTGRLDLTGVISGSHAVTVVGPGTVRVTATNTWIGDLFLNGGLFEYSNSDARFGNAANDIFLDGGGMRLTGGNLTLGSGRVITVDAGGGLITAETTRRLTINTADALTSGVSAGTLTLGDSTTTSGGTTVSAAQASFNAPISQAGGTNTFTSAAPLAAFNSPISASGAATNNTLNLQGAMDVFNNTITVSGGTLAFAATSSLPLYNTPWVQIGGTLTLAGSIPLFNQPIVHTAGTLNVSTALPAFASDVSISGGTVSAGSNQSFGTGMAGDGLYGSLTLTGGTLQVATDRGLFIRGPYSDVAGVTLRTGDADSTVPAGNDNVFIHGIHFANGVANVVNANMGAINLTNDDPVFGASGAGTSVTYLGTYTGDGNNTDPWFILQDGASFTVGAGAVLDTYSSFPNSRPMRFRGQGPASVFTMDAGYVAYPDPVGAPNVGLANLRIIDCTLVVSNGDSLPGNSGGGGFTQLEARDAMAGGTVLQFPVPVTYSGTISTGAHTAPLVIDAIADITLNRSLANGLSTGSNTTLTIQRSSGTGQVILTNDTIASLSGRLLVAPGNELVATSPSTVTINTTGNLQVDGIATLDGTVNLNGTLSGTGAVSAAAALTVGTTGIIAPAHTAIGTLSTTSVAMTDAGRLSVQVFDATGSAGSGYDQLAITGTLDLTAVMVGWEVALVSAADAAGTAGPAINFDGCTTPASWTILTTTGGILGFNAMLATVNTAGFDNSAPGSFTLAVVGNDLVLTYTPPAAGTLALDPLVGTPWGIGTMQPIAWTQTGLTNVAIDLSLDGGMTFPIVITASVSAASSPFNWTVNYAGLDAQIRVRNADPGCVPPSVSATLILLADLQGADKDVASADLSVLLASLETDAGGDLNNTTTTTAADLALLLEQFGLSFP